VSPEDNINRRFGKKSVQKAMSDGSILSYKRITGGSVRASDYILLGVMIVSSR